MKHLTFQIDRQVPLSSLTTLGIGGTAEYFVRAPDVQTAVSALSWATQKDCPVFILGGGSNLVVSDAGVDGLVIKMDQTGIELVDMKHHSLLTVKAGHPFDEVVSFAVSKGLAGIECLSGIPGSTGATPIQNVGAYGQEVSNVIENVTVLDRRTLSTFPLKSKDCHFGYRTSLFKQCPNTYVVLSVTFRLQPSLPAPVRYHELKQALLSTDSPSLSLIRETVLTLRRKKSMVLDPADENRRSVGSFFMNPILPKSQCDLIAQTAIDHGLIPHASAMPQYPVDEHTSKLSAGWLIEKSGIHKGFRQGQVGISSAHSLCLVHHGNGHCADLIALASFVQQTVLTHFGVFLHPEPTFLGFHPTPLQPKTGIQPLRENEGPGNS